MSENKKIVFVSTVLCLITIFTVGCSQNSDNTESESLTNASVSADQNEDIKNDKQISYDNGILAMNNEEWDKAIECFTGLQYNDSEDLLSQCVKEKGMHENADYSFLETMSEALMKRYEISKETDDAEMCVGVELEMLGDFKDQTFYDEKLKKIATQYIDGVELEKESFGKSNGRKQLTYYEGRAKRFEMLKLLTDNYGFLSDNVDYKVAYYNVADEEIEYYKALKEIETDLDEQFKDEINVESDGLNAQFQIKNNTEYNYDILIHFTFYGADGSVVGTDERYYEDVFAGKNYNIDFCFPSDADSFDYYTEEYLTD